MIRKLGEALGYDKLLQIFVEDGEEISKALNKLANEIGYEKVIEIVLNMLKDLPPSTKKKIAETALYRFAIWIYPVKNMRMQIEL